MIKFNNITVEDYDLDLTLRSGQTFVWDKIDDIWFGKTLDGLIILRQPSTNVIEWQTFPDNNNERLIQRYLRTDFDYQDLILKTKADQHFVRSLSKYKGLRLLHQNPLEMIISFIISANNSFGNIKTSIKKLSRLCGQKVYFEDKEFWLFPSITSLASANEDEIKKASVGFRGKYILETARKISTGSIIVPPVPGGYSEATEDALTDILLQLKGVGNKVADCVLAFGYGFDNVAPIDVWVGRVLTRYYGLPLNLSYKEMRSWAKGNMNGYASWVSQYLFELIRAKI